jgi:hypothetical protein
MLSTSEATTSREPVPGRAVAWGFEQPYADFEVDFLYNSLFCDSIALFRRDLDAAGSEYGQRVLSQASSADELVALVADDSAPSRLRALACRQLQRSGGDVDGGMIFGVVAEFPHADSQETLAAYADGGVRWIRHDGACTWFDPDACDVSARARKLVVVSQRLVQRFAAPQPRRPPSRDGRVRITLIAGDGLHAVEGHFHALQKDPIVNPVLGNAIWLLQAHAQAGARDAAAAGCAEIAANMADERQSDRIQT